ncbi:MAG: hypothetical protein P4L98_23610 [Ancalomicrobiaceae bacterium]|nr:hypothetical protein [Ancalomicrobiaceae bacterium]
MQSSKLKRIARRLPGRYSYLEDVPMDQRFARRRVRYRASFPGSAVWAGLQLAPLYLAFVGTLKSLDVDLDDL